MYSDDDDDAEELARIANHSAKNYSGNDYV